MRAFSIVALALAIAAPVLAADATPTKKGVEEPSAAPTLDAQIVQGCFSTSGTLVLNSTIKYNSKSSCAHDTCYAGGFKVAGTTQGKLCYCGNSLPPKADLVDDSECNVGCSGYDIEACGGISAFTIYNTGVSLVVDQDEDGTSSSASSTSKGPAVVTVSGSTVFVTTSNTPSSAPTSSANVAGIAAGVVVGVVALAGLSGLAFFLIRRRRNQEIEEEHRRNAAVNAFINGSKPPGSSGSMSMSDSRLDPVMAQRRMSSGSIADNEDYSRRILRVTNA